MDETNTSMLSSSNQISLSAEMSPYLDPQVSAAGSTPETQTPPSSPRQQSKHAVRFDPYIGQSYRRRQNLLKKSSGANNKDGEKTSWLLQSVASILCESIMKVPIPMNKNEYLIFAGEIYNHYVVNHMCGTALLDADNSEGEPDTAYVLQLLHDKFAWATYSYVTYIMPFVYQLCRKTPTGDDNPHFAPEVIFDAPSTYFNRVSTRRIAVRLHQWSRQEIERCRPHTTSFGVDVITSEMEPHPVFFSFLTFTFAPLIGSDQRRERSVGLPWSLLPCITTRAKSWCRCPTSQAYCIVMETNFTKLRFRAP